MKKTRSSLPLGCFLALAGTLLAPCLAVAQAPDNTGTNKRDRTENAVTADQQGKSTADRQLARKIRKEMVAGKALSLNARNVKVIVREGKVLLRGPVKNEDEKAQIAAIAARHAGSSAMVDNKLEVMVAQSDKESKEKN